MRNFTSSDLYVTQQFHQTYINQPSHLHSASREPEKRFRAGDNGFPVTYARGAWRKSGFTDIWAAASNLSAALEKAPGNNLAMYYANPGALSVPQQLYEGTMPRVLDSIRAPGTNNFSLAADKRFTLTERTSLTFRWEAFNLFNRVQFGAPNTTFNTADFGKTTSQANDPRIQQLSLRFSF